MTDTELVNLIWSRAYMDTKEHHARLINEYAENKCKTKAIRPNDTYIIPNDDKAFVDIMDLVNRSIAQHRFHYTSKTYKTFVVLLPDYNRVDPMVCDKVVEELRNAGYTASHQSLSCPHGPFMAITLRTDDFNPHVTEFTGVI